LDRAQAFRRGVTGHDHGWDLKTQFVADTGHGSKAVLFLTN
jgi:hypothetical protein